MHWFLVISMLGTDEVLVKEMKSKTECVKIQKNFLKKFKTKTFEKDSVISSVTCEEGELMESYDAGVKNDEVL